MQHEIHIYLGSACIAKHSEYKYPLGERHPFLLYLKANNNSEHDLTKAENAVSNLGLNEIEFTKFGKFNEDNINDEETREYYNNAMETGSTLIIYSDPV